MVTKNGHKTDERTNSWPQYAQSPISRKTAGFAICNNRCCEAVRSAVLATAWLLVILLTDVKNVIVAILFVKLLVRQPPGLPNTLLRPCLVVIRLLNGVACRAQSVTYAEMDRRTDKFLHCELKKLGHFYFYCNFGKCWSIFKILSMSESEKMSHNKNEKFPTIA